MLLALAFWTQARACSPGPVTVDAGFVRHDIGHLPRNARGVMFLGEYSALGPDEFKLTVGADPRPLRLRVDAPKGQVWARLEPVDGFRPGRRYHFVYLRNHARWRYPDRMDVMIDDARVDLAGDYAIGLKAAADQRVIAVPFGPACVEAVPAVVQDFTYRTPAALATYRKALDYRADVRMEATPPDKRQPDSIYWDNGGPRPYVDGDYGLDHGTASDYTATDNAIVAPCGLPRSLVVLRGWVGFPEVERRYAETTPATFELDGASPGRCERLPALLATMKRKGALRTLRTVCRFDPVVGAQAAIPYGPVSPEEKLQSWERNLWRLQDMNEFCTLAGLGYAWREGYLDTRPSTMARLGAVLAKAAGRAEPLDQREIPSWLAYVVAQLPPPTRATAARQFLAPIQPVLAGMLARDAPPQPEQTARLIAAGGRLAPDAAATLRAVAARNTEAGRLARALLVSNR